MENYFVYKFLSNTNEVLYVGKTKQVLDKRMSFHFGNSGHLSKEQLEDVVAIEYIELKSRVEMDIVELYYINKWKPPFNTNSKYDEKFNLDERDNDKWKPFELDLREIGTESREPQSKIRIELVLTSADSDIIEYLEQSELPRATQIKTGIRAQIKSLQETQLDERIKRLIGEVVGVPIIDTTSKVQQAYEHERAERKRVERELAILKDAISKLIA